jgi:glycosyltransferase involved in cell wall biosynthesis
MDITLSIIIPYYNAEPYMTELMKVLIPQLTAEVEIIVVDDGSEIPYEAPDERIKVVRQKNKGLAGARNTGLKHSKGKYIAFIDADDLVSGNFAEYILGRSNEKWDYMDLSWKSLEDNRYVYLLKSDSDRLSNPSVCTKVWSRAFIGKQRFNENKDVAEDEDFTRRIDLSRGKRICAPQFMYFYRVSTPNSLSKQYRSGTTKTKRIVYYFNRIPEDKALLEKVKRESETNEVVIMSNYENDEFKKYAQIISPIGTWADELGETLLI